MCSIREVHRAVAQGRPRWHRRHVVCVMTPSLPLPSLCRRHHLIWRSQLLRSRAGRGPASSLDLKRAGFCSGKPSRRFPMGGHLQPRASPATGPARRRRKPTLSLYSQTSARLLAPCCLPQEKRRRGSPRLYPPKEVFETITHAAELTPALHSRGELRRLDVGRQGRQVDGARRKKRVCGLGVSLGLLRMRPGLLAEGSAWHAESARCMPGS